MADESVSEPDGSLSGQTVFLSSGIRGIGLAIATSVSRRGANVAVLVKPDTPHASEAARMAVSTIEREGGRALAIFGDVRSEGEVAWAVDETVRHFGALDAIVNNAGVLSLDHTEALSIDQFDMLMQVNVRGAYVLVRAALPRLRESDRAHILTISPPLNMSERWLGAHPPYTLSKYGMTVLTLGWAAEFADLGIAANCLWPQTAIATPFEALVPGPRLPESRARKPEIVGDAAAELLSRSPALVTGRCLLDVEVLEAAGVTNFSSYGGGDHPQWDLFVDPVN